LCWHENLKEALRCYKCITNYYEFDFSTAQGFFVIMEEGPKQDWWVSFVYYLWCKRHGHPVWDSSCIPTEYINPPRMADALEEFLKEKNNE
jgi:hypothetical protein